MTRALTSLASTLAAIPDSAQYLLAPRARHIDFAPLPPGASLTGRRLPALLVIGTRGGYVGVVAA